MCLLLSSSGSAELDRRRLRGEEGATDGRREEGANDGRRDESARDERRDLAAVVVVVVGNSISDGDSRSSSCGW